MAKGMDPGADLQQQLQANQELEKQGGEEGEGKGEIPIDSLKSVPILGALLATFSASKNLPDGLLGILTGGAFQVNPMQGLDSITQAAIVSTGLDIGFNMKKILGINPGGGGASGGEDMSAGGEDGVGFTDDSLHEAGDFLNNLDSGSGDMFHSAADMAHGYHEDHGHAMDSGVLLEAMNHGKDLHSAGVHLDTESMEPSRSPTVQNRQQQQAQASEGQGV